MLTLPRPCDPPVITTGAGAIPFESEFFRTTRDLEKYSFKYHNSVRDKIDFRCFFVSAILLGLFSYPGVTPSTVSYIHPNAVFFILISRSLLVRECPVVTDCYLAM